MAIGAEVETLPQPEVALTISLEVAVQVERKCFTNWTWIIGSIPSGGMFALTPPL